ncbi:s1 RNA binding domain-containing protein [Ditylenchus destructor]|nr:s1 RNA binding domain-containing protein [Ditylenchus destructor]
MPYSWIPRSCPSSRCWNAILSEIAIRDIAGSLGNRSRCLKSEALIPLEQFYNDAGDLTINVGDEVHVALDSVEDGFGETKLSREKAKRAECWIVLEAAFAAEEVVKGVINGKVKGGFTVDVNGIRAFLPGSLVDVRPVRDTTHLEGKELDSRSSNSTRSATTLSFPVAASWKQRTPPSVKLCWNPCRKANNQRCRQEPDRLRRVCGPGRHRRPAAHHRHGVEAYQASFRNRQRWRRDRCQGSEIRSRAQPRFAGPEAAGRGSMGCYQSPLPRKHSRYRAVTNLTDYGCFAELEEGVEGLVHVSEMDWTNKNVNPSKVVQVGDEVEVMVLDVDEERRRISLGMKQCKSNPWEDFSGQFNKGDKISGTIKSITDFGIFIGLDGGIDGLVHLSDISWNEVGEEAVRRFKKGDELDTVILSVDPERERISLASSNWKAIRSPSTVKEVDAKGAIIVLADDIEATLKASEISRDRVEDARNVLKEGQEVEAKIISVDRKSRVIQLSSSRKTKWKRKKQSRA